MGNDEMKLKERTINLNGETLTRDEDGEYVAYDPEEEKDYDGGGQRWGSVSRTLVLVFSSVALALSIASLVMTCDLISSTPKNNLYAVTDNGLNPVMKQMTRRQLEQQLAKEAEERTYTVTVQYNFSDGGKAHPSYCEKVKSGGSVEIASPTIKGFRPDQDVVRLDNVTGDYVVVVSYYDVAQPSKDRPDPARSSTELEQNVPHPDTPPSKKNPVSE